jgi:serine/threonine protein kinase
MGAAPSNTTKNNLEESETRTKMSRCAEIATAAPLPTSKEHEMPRIVSMGMITPPQKKELIPPEVVTFSFLNHATNKLEEYTRKKTEERIGEGAFGIVTAVTHKGSGKAFAMKRIDLNRNNAPHTEDFIREFISLMALKHPGIVDLQMMFIEKNFGYLFLERMKQNLAEYFKDNKSKLAPRVAYEHMKSLASAVAFIHENDYMHRDIKPQNILVDYDGSLKLSDFGCCRKYLKHQPEFLYSLPVVTLWYRPPEVLFRNAQYSPAIDVWSLACVFIELLEGAPVMPGQSNIEQIMMIFRLIGSAVPNVDVSADLMRDVLTNMADPNDPHAFPRYPKGFRLPFPCRPETPSELIKLIQLMLVYHPKKRPTARQVSNLLDDFTNIIF